MMVFFIKNVHSVALIQGSRVHLNFGICLKDVAIFSFFSKCGFIVFGLS